MSEIQNSNFKRLIGKWKTEGRILKNETDSKSKITGSDTYEFILGENFILHQADVKMGGIRSETYEIIELDNSNDRIRMRYYNSNGESGVMFGFLEGNDFKIESEKLRFNGNISKDDTLIEGTWQQLSVNDKWSDFLEMRLSK